MKFQYRPTVLKVMTYTLAVLFPIEKRKSSHLTICWTSKGVLMHFRLYLKVVNSFLGSINLEKMVFFCLFLAVTTSVVGRDWYQQCGYWIKSKHSFFVKFKTLLWYPWKLSFSNSAFNTIHVPCLIIDLICKLPKFCFCNV